MKNSSIFLIRHGLTEGNIKDWYYGGVDILLIPEAFSQLDEYIAGEIYPKGDDISFYTSGMTRAIQTLKMKQCLKRLLPKLQKSAIFE